MSAKWAVSGFALFIGSICLIYRLIMSSKLKNQVRADGRVLACAPTSRGDSGFNTIFVVPGNKGQDVECKMTTNHGYAVGDVVPVLHPADYPSHASIYEPFIHKLFGSWLLYGMIALLIVAQLGLIPED